MCVPTPPSLLHLSRAHSRTNILPARHRSEAFIARRKAKKESLEKKAKEEAQAAGWDEVPRRGSGSTASRVRMRQRVLGLE